MTENDNGWKKHDSKEKTDVSDNPIASSQLPRRIRKLSLRTNPKYFSIRFEINNNVINIHRMKITLFLKLKSLSFIIMKGKRML